MWCWRHELGGVRGGSVAVKREEGGDGLYCRGRLLRGERKSSPPFFLLIVGVVLSGVEWGGEDGGDGWVGGVEMG